MNSNQQPQEEQSQQNAQEPKECPCCFNSLDKQPRINICGLHEMCLQCYSKMALHSSADFQKCPVCRIPQNVSFQQVKHSYKTRYFVIEYNAAGRFVVVDKDDTFERRYQVLFKKHGKVQVSKECRLNILAQNISTLVNQLQVPEIMYGDSIGRVFYQMRFDAVSQQFVIQTCAVNSQKRAELDQEIISSFGFLVHN